MNAPPGPNRPLCMSALSEFYESIVTRAFNPLHPITRFLVNWHLTLSQSDSCITHVLTSPIDGWIVKYTPFRGPWRKKSGLYFERYIIPDLSSPNGVIKRLNLDHMGFLMMIPSWEKNTSWYLWVQNISTENSDKGSRYNLYSLSVIRSFAGFTKIFIFLFLLFEVMHDWWIYKM